uniref:hypothetical protein n=1 Tax=Limnohabitans sp. TaxID=1907725 RepID=UPI004048A534
MEKNKVHAGPMRPDGTQRIHIEKPDGTITGLTLNHGSERSAPDIQSLERLLEKISPKTRLQQQANLKRLNQMTRDRNEKPVKRKVQLSSLMYSVATVAALITAAVMLPEPQDEIQWYWYLFMVAAAWGGWMSTLLIFIFFEERLSGKK